jgi:hypothetical protein
MRPVRWSEDTVQGRTFPAVEVGTDQKDQPWRQPAERRARRRTRGRPATDSAATTPGGRCTVCQVSSADATGVIAVVGGGRQYHCCDLPQIFHFTAGPGMPTCRPPLHRPRAAPLRERWGDVPAKTIAEGRTWTATSFSTTVKLGISRRCRNATGHLGVHQSHAKNFFPRQQEPPATASLTAPRPELIQCGSADGRGSGDVGFSFGPLENTDAGRRCLSRGDPMARGTAAYTRRQPVLAITYADTKWARTGVHAVFGKPQAVSQTSSGGSRMAASPLRHQH